MGPGVELLDVVAGAERLAGAAEHEHSAVAVDVNLFDGGVQFCRHLPIQRIVDLRAIERERGDRAVLADDQLAGGSGMVGHDSQLLCVPGSGLRQRYDATSRNGSSDAACSGMQMPCDRPPARDATGTTVLRPRNEAAGV